MQYSLEKTIDFSDTVVRIYRPKLTEEEKSKRLQKIKETSAKLILGVVKK